MIPTAGQARQASIANLQKKVQRERTGKFDRAMRKINEAKEEGETDARYGKNLPSDLFTLLEMLGYRITSNAGPGVAIPDFVYHIHW